jgi:hypothetical protein
LRVKRRVDKDMTKLRSTGCEGLGITGGRDWPTQ